MSGKRKIIPGRYYLFTGPPPGGDGGFSDLVGTYVGRDAAIVDARKYFAQWHWVELFDSRTNVLETWIPEREKLEDIE